MSYSATVYNVMIASPSDVVAERNIVPEVLAQWNAANSSARKIVLLPLGWETHSSPEMGDRPQAIINKQVLKDCDLLIGVFWTRIGTITGSHESGSVEEIEEHIRARKPTMLYFSDAPVHPASIDAEQYGRLKTFKLSCQKRGLLQTYTEVNDFRTKLYHHLQLKVNQDPIFVRDVATENIQIGHVVEPRSVPIIALSQEGKTLLMNGAQDPNGYLLFMETMGGTTVQTNSNSIYEGSDPRLIATWKSALDELDRKGMIEATNFKRDIFKMTRKGYEAADRLKP